MHKPTTCTSVERELASLIDADTTQRFMKWYKDVLAAKHRIYLDDEDKANEDAKVKSFLEQGKNDKDVKDEDIDMKMDDKVKAEGKPEAASEQGKGDIKLDETYTFPSMSAKPQRT